MLVDQVPELLLGNLDDVATEICPVKSICGYFVGVADLLRGWDRSWWGQVVHLVGVALRHWGWVV